MAGILAAPQRAAGEHGLYLHAVGRCDAPAFTSAGGHFAPAGRAHGYLDPKGPHAGDLPNAHVPSDGRLTVEFLAPDVSLHGPAASLLDADGAALVLHAGADDYRTDPSGGSGDRIACGVIQTVR